MCVCVCVDDDSLFSHLTVLISCVSPDALPAALQSPGETAPAEVVHSHVRPRKEENHQGNDLHGVVTTAALLQLPALERPEDHLQEVGTPCTYCLPGLCLHVHEDPRRCGKLHFPQLFLATCVLTFSVTFSPGTPVCSSAWL